MAKVLVMNGPNLNLLGVREPTVYGRQTLLDVEKALKTCPVLGSHVLVFMQSNAEHVLIDTIHEAYQNGVSFLIINAGALTHTSVALRDALLGTNLPFIEVHVSNVFAREPFRHHSYLSDIAKGVICGLGTFGYEAALTAAIHYIEASGASDGY